MREALNNICKTVKMLERFSETAPNVPVPAMGNILSGDGHSFPQSLLVMSWYMREPRSLAGGVDLTMMPRFSLSQECWETL